ncbi:MAG: PH domain-containing protein [Candidatus Aenigmarchaeota archaeon]|nr:PH domain-containing protein [Candidatus Aenigmarchaeota archaeon]
MSKLHPKSFYLFWWSYFWAFFFIFIFLAGFIGIAVLAMTQSLGAFFVYAIFVMLLAVAVSGVWSKLMYESYSYELSKMSLNVKWGVLRKHSATIPYSRIQNIDVNRGIMARLLGLGELWIQTAGVSTAFTKFGALRFSEGIIPGLEPKEAEKLRTTLLKRIKGKQGL